MSNEIFMEITEKQLALATVGTLVCCLGFLKWPKSTYDLLRPRFIVPALIWYGTFDQVFFHWIMPQPAFSYANYGKYISEKGTTALTYFIVCLMMFWIGYCSPFGRLIGKLFAPIQFNLPLIPRRLQLIRWFGIITSVIIFGLLIGTSGGAALDNSHSLHQHAYLRSGILGVTTTIMTLIGAACIGASWPRKVKEDSIGVVLSVIALFLLSAPLMANFSRGTGLPVIIAALGYIVRHREIRFVWVGLAGCWVMLAAHAGLSGRGVYGHGGGVVPYVTHLFSDACFAGTDMLPTAVRAGDAYTATSVTMKAHEATDIRPLSPGDWLLFQVPVPRIFGFRSEWTVSVPLFLGGYGSWNFTTSIFGDTFIHFGWWGSLTFIFFGLAYRLVSFLAFDLAEKRPYFINPFIFMLATSYLAIFNALFNTYRSWVVSFFYPFYLVILLMLILSAMRAPTPFLRSGRSTSPKISPK